MKLKYYLRGLGIGIIITTLVLMIAYSGYTKELTDEEIIARAGELGMVMKEDPLFSNSESDKNSENIVASEVIEDTESSVIPETEDITATEVTEVYETDTQTEIAEPDTEKITETESETEEVPSGEMYHLVIPAGSVPRLICNELEEQGVIESAASLRQYLVDVGFAKSINVGEYDIPYGATNDEVYQILKAGPQ